MSSLYSIGIRISTMMCKPALSISMLTVIVLSVTTITNTIS